MKQSLGNNYEFLVNFHQLLRIQGKTKEYLEGACLDVSAEGGGIPRVDFVKAIVQGTLAEYNSSQ